MNAKLRFFSLVAVALLVGCGNQTSGSGAPVAKAEQAADMPPPPVIDTTTPDKAVKSLWATIDWTKAFVHAKGARPLTAEEVTLKKLQAQLSVPAIASPKIEKGQLEQYSRDILKADVETESRAIVLAQVKNVTPLPADAVLGQYELKAREQGERVKYVLEKTAGAWQISEAWVFQDYNAEWRKARPSEAKLYPVHVFDAW